MARVTRSLCVIAVAALVVVGISVAPAGATGSHGGGGWPTGPSQCSAPLSPVVPKPSGWANNGTNGCARLLCPLGWAVLSPYKDGSSPVFYSIAHAIYQGLQNPFSTAGCVEQSTSTPTWHPVGSLPSWIDHSLCRMFGLPTYTQLARNRR
jgi:hypothetical protein